MIFGIGTDIVELSRVQGIYDRFGDHFARRILMDEELALYMRSKDPVRFLAMRFAGKEATVKAMGTVRAWGVVTRRRYTGERLGTAHHCMVGARQPGLRATRYRQRPRQPDR